MGNGSLRGDATTSNIVAKLNALLHALRGNTYPRNTGGDVVSGDGTNAPDIGSATSPFNRAYISSIVAGGIAVDIAALAEGGVDVVIESDADYRWAQGATKGLFILGSGQSGAGGGGSGWTSDGYLNNDNDHNRYRIWSSVLQRYSDFRITWIELIIGSNGSRGQIGGKSSLTHIRPNIIKETGEPYGGDGGGGTINFRGGFAKPLPNNMSNDDDYSTSLEKSVLFEHDSSNNSGGRGGFRKDSRELTPTITTNSVNIAEGDPISISGVKGGAGGRQIHSFIIEGIQQGDLFNIQIGAGGLGGAATITADARTNHANNPAPRAPTAGGDGGGGFCMIIPINDPTA